MKLNPRHRLLSIGAFVIAVTLADYARSDDLPGSTSKANDASQFQAPMAGGNGQSPAIDGKKAEIAPVAPSPDTVQSTVSPRLPVGSQPRRIGVQSRLKVMFPT